ncbi:MAG TPA: hypothetical protein VLV45_09130 [Gemmatimonadales bacterium]|nr:hypothetical protein [Gemmatimonadales bacterium]
MALSIFALCWLVGGPGAVALEVSLGCRMDRMHHQGHHHHSSPSNPHGPCICDQMGGTFDVLVSVGLPPVLDLAPATRAPEIPTASVARVLQPTSTDFGPDTPPPIALAS